MINRQKNSLLIFIAFLIILSIWIDASKTIRITNPFNQKVIYTREVPVRLGLDLRGGLQTLLEADLPEDVPISQDDLKVAKTILENRANALGVSEVVMQTAGDRRLVAEFPGIDNPEEVTAAMKETGLLEFVDMGTKPLPEGTVIETDYGRANVEQTETPTEAATESATPEATAEASATPEEGAAPTEEAEAPKIYHTVMTGAALDSASVSRDNLGQYQISFSLKPDGAKLFAEYTASHVGQYLAIVLDKKVISAPRIQSAIKGGQGVITGKFTYESANNLAIQLRYGSLPIPLKIVESRTVGPTLGEESVHKSILAGAIGLTIVMLFMALYYRFPGIVADLALIVYGLITLALFKLIPVVLTLPGIAGFVLSIGMAVDANVLIFERLKEELRAGRNLHTAIDLGWARAWPSIRDANISTLITTVILFWFGSVFGASLVKGFALTLALGVLVSLFTAITVTRVFLHLILDNIKFSEHHAWFGL